MKRMLIMLGMMKDDGEEEEVKAHGPTHAMNI